MNPDQGQLPGQVISAPLISQPLGSLSIFKGLPNQQAEQAKQAVQAAECVTCSCGLWKLYQVVLLVQALCAELCGRQSHGILVSLQSS